MIINKFMYFIVFLFLFLVYKNINNFYNKEFVALLNINGVITDKNVDINDLLSNNKMNFSKFLIVKINSPGGSPVGSSYIFESIFYYKKLHEKKIFFIIDEVCASAGYFISIVGNKIYANESSIVGSIGVIISSFNLRGISKKIGVIRKVYKSGQFKDIMDPFKFDKDDKYIILKNLNIIHDVFINVVIKSRKNILNSENKLFDGRFWSGEQAFNIGIIDGFCSLYTLCLEIMQINNIIVYNNRISL